MREPCRKVHFCAIFLRFEKEEQQQPNRVKGVVGKGGGSEVEGCSRLPRRPLFFVGWCVELKILLFSVEAT